VRQDFATRWRQIPSWGVIFLRSPVGSFSSRTRCLQQQQQQQQHTTSVRPSSDVAFACSVTSRRCSLLWATDASTFSLRIMTSASWRHEVAMRKLNGRCWDRFNNARLGWRFVSISQYRLRFPCRVVAVLVVWGVGVGIIRETLIERSRLRSGSLPYNFDRSAQLQLSQSFARVDQAFHPSGGSPLVWHDRRLFKVISSLDSQTGLVWLRSYGSALGWM